MKMFAAHPRSRACNILINYVAGRFMSGCKTYENVIVKRDDRVLVVTINRPQRRNAVDKNTASELRDAFTKFDNDDTLDVAVLTGADNTFCAGYDLKSLSLSDVDELDVNLHGPMGPTRMLLSKPCIAAIEGYCVAGVYL